jgi:hypothetical protein
VHVREEKIHSETAVQAPPNLRVKHAARKGLRSAR